MGIRDRPARGLRRARHSCVRRRHRKAHPSTIAGADSALCRTRWISLTDAVSENTPQGRRTLEGTSATVEPDW